MTYYTLKDGKITSFGKIKFFDDCLETEEDIVEDYKHQYRFASELMTDEYKKEEQTYYSTLARIDYIKQKLNELSNDFVQAQLGAKFDDLEERKAEFVRLHNELRQLLGKEPRIYE